MNKLEECEVIVDDDLRLLKKLIKVADGHLTIMKFTTNWRIGFGTPIDRTDIDALAPGITFAEAARAALARRYR
jgi:hypothetical protein